MITSAEQDLIDSLRWLILTEYGLGVSEMAPENWRANLASACHAYLRSIDENPTPGCPQCQGTSRQWGRVANALRAGTQVLRVAAESEEQNPESTLTIGDVLDEFNHVVDEKMEGR